MARGRMFEENDFNSLPAESDYMSPFAVQPSYVPAPVASPLAVQPSYAPMGGDYDLSPEVLAQLAALGFDPYAGGQTPMANPVSSPLAVRGMPEMNPAEFSSLAVPGVPPAVQEQAKADLLADPNVTVLPGSLDDLSRFGGLGGLDGYEANSSGAPVGMPTSYAFPENYGNPKNKIYNLTAGPEDNIRLKFTDGTTMFEGKGPEAAAKAAAMVQELGKKFNTQSTWILDKQTAGGDWKQVSQDTVGEKKKTALNSFLDVVAPIAGALLAVVPGVGLLAAPGLLGGAGAGLGLSTATAGALGAAGGSLLNSGLQNQNSAEAFKKAALAAATTYIGAKVGDLVKSGISASSMDPTSAVGIRNLHTANLKAGLDAASSAQKIAALAKAAGETLSAVDVLGVISESASNGLVSASVGEAADLAITGLKLGTGAAGAVVGGAAGAGLAGVGGLTAGTGGVTNAATNTATNTTAETQSGLDAANDAAINDVQIAGTGTPVDTNVGLEIAGGLGGTGLTNVFNPVTVNPEPVTVTAEPKPVDQTLAVPTPVTAPITTPAVNPDFVAKPEELVIEANEPPPTNEPVTPTPVVAPEPVVNPDFVSKPNDAELEIEADKKPVEEPVTPTPVVTPEPVVNPDFVAKPEELVIEADKRPVEEPLKPTPVVTPEPAVNTDFQVDTGKTDAELEIEARKKAELDRATGVPITTPNPGTPVNLTPDTTVITSEPKDPRVAGPVTQAALTDALTNGIYDLTITGPRPTTPIKVEPLQAPDPKLDPITAGLSGLLGEPTPKTPMEKTQDWIKKHPLEAASLGLTLIGGLGGAGSGGGSGGSGVNTLGYPGGTQPGTPGSLGGTFTSTLPTAPSSFSVTPRDMGKRDWLRYGFGPEASFFSNVPDRQALAVNPAPAAQTSPVAQTSPAAQTSPLAVNPTPSPVIEEMPALSEKLSEPAPDLMVKPDTQTASVPADGTMLNGNPSIVWNGGVNGGWMQTERGMPPPEEIATQAAFARGGSTSGTSSKPRTEFAVHGAGTGRSDDIPAVLSDGEYVMDAETVALLGDGSSKAGAEKLDQLRVNLRRHKGANLAKGRFSVNAKSPEKYLAGGRV